MKIAKKLLFAASLFLVFVLFSCSEKDEDPEEETLINTCLSDNKITISNIADIPETVTFNKVKVEIQGNCWEIVTIAEATFQDGEAVLTLPTEFTAEELCKVVRSNYSDYEGFWPAQTDNADARVAGFSDIIAYNNDKQVGRLILSDTPESGYEAGKTWVYYHYTNQTFTLSGYNLTRPGENKSFKYNATFQPGWNAYIKTAIKNEELLLCTTIIPEELPLSWRFESWEY